jgi:kynurenine formamidase
MAERRLPTQEEVQSYLSDRSNWGRWGEDDQVGAINLITPEKRVAAGRLLRTGRTVSLSRYFPKTPSPENTMPAHHWMRKRVRDTGYGGSQDYLGIFYHGFAATHIDALCHVWDPNGMWNGRDHNVEITFDGANFGSIDHWSDGIITRGVLLDITKHRGEPYVTMERPVHGWELEDAARAQGVTLEPGDAVVVYSGRDRWNDAHPDAPWGSDINAMPGLHASCLPFIRDNDISVMVWDMMDFLPSGYGDIRLPVHGALYYYGVALLDNALLHPLAEACAQEGRYEFMLMVAPLKVAGGTGSPVNPLAVF